MKILNIVSHSLFPISDGGRAHSFSNIVSLSQTNSVTILSPDKAIPDTYNNHAIALSEFSLPPNKWKFLSPLVLWKIRKLSKSVDRIIIDYPWFALHCLIMNIPYEIREHNIEFLRFKSYQSWFWPVLYLYEKLAYKYAKKVHCISQEDQDGLLENFSIDPQKCVLAPYCPDITRFYPTSSFKEEIRKKLNLKKQELCILFFGKLDYKPNIEAIDIINQEIIPRLNKNTAFEYKIVICGKNANQIANENIIYTGFVDKIEHYVQSCDVMINPIISGGGVKTKVMETLNCKKKVVSTEHGAVGIKPEDNLIIIKSWDDMVAKLIELSPKVMATIDASGTEQ
jgi:glycosyltransferase involved in cell wall biosynthesis